MPTAPFEFESAAGYRLAGRLELPSIEARGWAVFSHCFACGADSLAAVRISRRLAERGMGVLRYDFAGLGRSGGNPLRGLSADVDDLVSAVQVMERCGMAVSLMVGHSLGGVAAIAASTRLPGIRALVTIGSPASAGHLAEGRKAETDDRESAITRIDVGGRSFEVAADFVDDLAGYDLARLVREADRPLLVLHAPHDRIVGIEHAARIYAAARHPKSFVSLDTADHLLTRKEDAFYAADLISAWAQRYVPTVEVRSAEAYRGARARPTGAGVFQTEVLLSPGLRLLADEPASAGGMETGPTPFDLLAAALASCTAMTLRMYGSRHGWMLDHLEVVVDHARTPQGIPSFSCRIDPGPDLTIDQARRLLAIAGRCPVHKALAQTAIVEAKLSSDAEGSCGVKGGSVATANGIASIESRMATHTFPPPR